MLDLLFGWRKASKCKKLIKRTQCRLKLLRNKRVAVARILKEDTAQLLKNGHEQIAMNKLDQLYVEENMLSVCEMLHTFSDFILLNLSYIRRHKDIPNDVNEAISTLIFASARIGELPDLRILRKLFAERYGKKFVAAAIELYPGNLVNCQVKDSFTSRAVPEDVRNRMIDEIVRCYFFKPGQFAIESKPDNQEQLDKVSQSIEVQREVRGMKEIIPSTQSSIVLESWLSVLDAPTISEVVKLAQRSPPYEHKTRGYFSKNTILHLDDVEEYSSQNKQSINSGNPDQRFFMFKMKSDLDNEQAARKRIRRGKSVAKGNQVVDDAQTDTYYTSSPGDRRKYQKKIHIDHEKEGGIDYEGQSEMKHQAFDCSCKLKCNLYQSCYSYANEGYDIHILRHGYGKEIGVTSPRPVENGFGEINAAGSRNLASPSHVHPKLPDYDEIASMFMELKKAHLQTKGGTP